MAIASMVCGIISLISLMYFGIGTLFLGVNIIDEIGNDFFNGQIIVFFISLIFLILALIFGNIERKEEKKNINYNMATSGIVMGLIGITFTILSVTVPVINFSVEKNRLIAEDIEDNRLIAEQEFFDLADLATSAGIFSFMDERFVEIIQRALEASSTLEGIIISSPNGEYGFEKERGKAIVWKNGSPQFLNSSEFSKEILYLPLRIQGLSNVNIQAEKKKK
jgi:hypothetical protein